MLITDTYAPRSRGLNDTKLVFLGYWRTPDRPSYPNPVDYIDVEWDEVERDTVVRYLKAQEVLHSWRGYTGCRLCGISNGSTCLSDGVYVWPEGFSHYIEQHAVRPPQTFIDHVLKAKHSNP